MSQSAKGFIRSLAFETILKSHIRHYEILCSVRLVHSTDEPHHSSLGGACSGSTDSFHTRQKELRQPGESTRVCF